MSIFILDAELIPGKSAAGFQIGKKISDYPLLIKQAKKVELDPGVRLFDIINDSDGVLYHSVLNPEFDWETKYISFFYKNDIVRLNFNTKEVLYAIWIFEGYQGKFNETIGIGSPLREVEKLFDLVYEEGDEMYYPDDEKNPNVPDGIAFMTAENDDGSPGKGDITGFCVHNWNLML